MAPKWSLSDIPDLTDTTAVITGGNIGLGFKTALELARRRAKVVIGSRSSKSGETAAERIRAEIPDARISFNQLELTDTVSIADFSRRFLDGHDRLDILLHNAGLVIHPRYEVTTSGRELQMQVNHLGHFALAGQLMPLLAKTKGARLVQSTTVPYQKGKIDFDDFDWVQRDYNPMQAYFDSRLAQLLFAFALNQKFKQKNISTEAISMQPGLVNTEGLQKSDFGGRFMKVLAQSLEMGCRTHLRSCTDPVVDSDYFWEPRFAIRGKTMPKKIKAPALDAEAAARLMVISEELTGIRMDVGK